MKEKLHFVKAVKLISNIVEAEPLIQDETVEFIIEVVQSDYHICIDRLEIEKSIEIINRSQHDCKFSLYTGNCYEVLIREDIDGLAFFNREELETPIVDKENALTYQFRVPTLTFIIYLLYHEIITKPASSLSRNGIKYHENATRLTIEQYFYRAKLTQRSLKISSENILSVKMLKSLVDSFIFELGYKSKKCVRPVYSIEELSKIKCFPSIEITEVREINFPKRLYGDSLVGRYQMALSSEIPFVKFISYYHIIEHFFEMILNENLVKITQNMITAPNFSYNSKNDINRLIKKVINVHKSYSYNEQEALRLTMVKYVDIDDLKSDLSTKYRKEYEFYKSSVVSFSEGGIIDFDQVKDSEIYKSIANRIYETRNSVVHSKEGEKPKYIPFTHDDALALEIPLIELIAEQVIINSADILDLLKDEM